MAALVAAEELAALQMVALNGYELATAAVACFPSDPTLQRASCELIKAQCRDDSGVNDDARAADHTQTTDCDGPRTSSQRMPLAYRKRSMCGYHTSAWLATRPHSRTCKENFIGCHAYLVARPHGGGQCGRRRRRRRRKHAGLGARFAATLRALAPPCYTPCGVVAAPGRGTEGRRRRRWRGRRGRQCVEWGVGGELWAIGDEQWRGPAARGR